MIEINYQDDNLLKATLVIRPLESWVVDISKKLGVSIHIVECITGRDGEVSGLINFKLDETSRESVIEELYKHPDVNEVHVSDEVNGTVLGSLTVKKWMVCESLHRSNCYIEGARTLSNGAVEWHIMVTDEITLKGLVGDLKKSGCKVELIRKRQIKESAILTNKQEKIIASALEMGYFDYPRGVTGRELARRLRITQSTLYETLQASQKKLAELYLMRKRLS